MKGLASLPMYDFPELERAHRALWRAIRTRIAALLSEQKEPDVPMARGLPEHLARPADHYLHWENPALVFSQTCGLPFLTRLLGRARIIGTPRYDAEGTIGHDYSSAWVVRSAERTWSWEARRRGRIAVNRPDSYSGLVAPKADLARRFPEARRDGGAERRPFFSSLAWSGSHRRSVRRVREGRADIAAVDAVTWALLERHVPGETAGLTVLEFTRPAPGLPYVTSASTPPRVLETLRLAVSSAIGAPALAPARATLLLEGLDGTDEVEYERLRPDIAAASDLTLGPEEADGPI